MYATASGRNTEFLRELGADVAIDYNTDQLKEFAGQMDLVFDLAGGKTEESSWAALKPDGMLVLAAGQPNLALARSPGQRARFAMSQSTPMTWGESRECWTIISCASTISGRFTLEQVGARKSQLERGGSRGKLLVIVSQEFAPSNGSLLK